MKQKFFPRTVVKSFCYDLNLFILTKQMSNVIKLFVLVYFMLTLYIAGIPSLSEVNTINLPSGEKAG